MKQLIIFGVASLLIMGLAGAVYLYGRKNCDCPPMNEEQSAQIVEKAAFIGRARVLSITPVEHSHALTMKLEIVEMYKNEAVKLGHPADTFNEDKVITATANAHLPDNTTQCLTEGYEESGIYEVILTPDFKLGYVLNGPCDSPLSVDWKKLRYKNY